MIQKVKKNIFISLSIAAILYLALTFYANFNQVVAAFVKFNWVWFPILLLLPLMNYIMRFFKWDFYLRILNINLSKIDSFSIFMSGLVMSFTPGKMGELMKSYLVKQIKGESISKTAPIIMVERITDFISLVLIAVIGSYTFNYGRVIVVGTGIFFLIITLVISSRTLSLRIIKALEHISFLKKQIEKIENAYETAYFLLKPKPLFYMIIVSLFAWFFEGFAYYLVLLNFGYDFGINWAIFIYSFATIAGSITMLPGGLGVTDGSLTYLVMRKGIPLNVAVSSTFIIRVVTLWFAILIGALSVSLYQKRFGKITVTQE